MVRDCERQCAALGVAFRLPDPFPQNTLTAARVALAALAEGWGEDFSRAVYRAQFAEGRQIGSPDVIGEIVRDLGHDDAVLARAQSDAIKQELRADDRGGAAARHFRRAELRRGRRAVLGQ